MTIGFIGLGNMSSAVIRGLAANEEMRDAVLCGYNPHIEKALALKESCGLVICDSNAEVVEMSDVIVLGVKPQVIEGVLAELPAFPAEKLVISMIAAKTIGWLGEHAGTENIVRAMPNTNAIIGEAITGLWPAPAVAEEGKALAEKIFLSVGETIWLKEDFISILGAVGGASLAYTHMYINALAEAGLRAGMSKKQALTIASTAVKGAAMMQLATGEHPYALADMVTSPGGTTVEGVMALDRMGFCAAVHEAIHACIEKEKLL